MTKVDDSFQFVDCADVDFEHLARDIRAGIIEIKYKKIVIALGNTANFDNYTNVVVPVNAFINALIDRYGCLNVEIWIANIIPRPDATSQEVTMIMKQNKGLWKAVRALVRRRKYPVTHIGSHKWFMKRVRQEDGMFQVCVDRIYCCQGTIHLNQQGLQHLCLLLAKELQLWDVKYQWSEMPIVMGHPNKKRKVFPQ